MHALHKLQVVRKERSEQVENEMTDMQIGLISWRLNGKLLSRVLRGRWIYRPITQQPNLQGGNHQFGSCYEASWKVITFRVMLEQSVVAIEKDICKSQQTSLASIFWFLPKASGCLNRQEAERELRQITTSVLVRLAVAPEILLSVPHCTLGT